METSYVCIWCKEKYFSSLFLFSVNLVVEDINSHCKNWKIYNSGLSNEHRSSDFILRRTECLNLLNSHKPDKFKGRFNDYQASFTAKDLSCGLAVGYVMCHWSFPYWSLQFFIISQFCHSVLLLLLCRSGETHVLKRESSLNNW